MREEKLLAKLQEVRRQLHRRAETGFAVDRTRAYLARLFARAGIHLREAGGGLVADLGQGEGAVLLRAEMDALPLMDAKEAPYASRQGGACHACGHDGHMAMLYGAALLLKEKKLPGRVRLAFQPAEECPPGGALGMVKAGVLQGVKAAFALHLAPFLPFGKVGIKPGELMAAADNFRLTVCGRGGHGAQPHCTVDAVVVAAHVVTALQSLVSRQNDPLEPLVLTVGKISGGTACNVVADAVVLEGTVRTLDMGLRDKVPGMIEALARGVCSAFGAECSLEYLLGYPVLRNDQAMAELAAAAAEDVSPGSSLWLPRPLMGGEDFAYVLGAVPGCLAFLGTGGDGFGFPLHHPRFDFDESILPFGAALLARVTERALGQS